MQPYSYFTDGGTYNDDHYYFLQNIFAKTTICYSTKIPKNANVQAYLGRKVAVDPTVVSPKLHKVKGEANMICLPYEKHFADKTEEETFKLVTELTLHNMGWGYTCFASAFALFISEKEVKIAKSQVVQFFNNINTEQAFLDLKLPIKSTQTCSDGTANKAFEIDLTQ